MPTMPHRAAGWRIEPPVSVPIAERRVEGGDRRRRAAAAAAGHPVERPRVGRRAVGRMLGRRAHRELVHVRLAEDHRTGVAQPLGDVRVVRGEVALEDPRAGGALAARHGDEVLERDRDRRAADGAASSAAGPSARAAASRRRRRRPRRGRRSRSIVEPRVERAVVALGERRGGPRSARATTARRRAAGRPSRGRGGASGLGIDRSGRQSPPRIAGTTMKSPSRAGALASTASTRQRRPDDVVAQDVLELDRLGGRRDVRRWAAGQDRVLVEDVVELALEPGELLVGQPEPREVGDVLDVGSGQGGHAPDDSRRYMTDGRGRPNRWWDGRRTIGRWVILRLGGAALPRRLTLACLQCGTPAARPDAHVLPAVRA